MTASTRQIDGRHYADLPEHAQPWNVLAHWLTPEEYRGWQKGNAIVYLARERQKGGDTDIRKASHHLERLIEEFAPPRGDEQASESDIGKATSLDLTKDPAYRAAYDAAYFREHPITAYSATSPNLTPLPVHETPEPTDPRMKAKADDGGWIEWKGGECPVDPYAVVEFKNSMGETLRSVAKLLEWDSSKVDVKVVAYRLHKPSQPEEPEKAAEPILSNSTELDPHAELRKTWKPGQRWELRWPLHGGAMSAWYPITAEQPMWDATCEYRRHPEDRDPEPQQWPYYSAGPDHSKAKELWGDGKGMEVAYASRGMPCDEVWFPFFKPSWGEDTSYWIRPQGAQA